MLFEVLHHGEPIVLKVYGTINTFRVEHSGESLRFCAKKLDTSLKRMISCNNVLLHIGS